MYLTKVSDLYTEDKEGNPILLKKGVKTKVHIIPGTIILVEEIVSKKGIVLKSKCKVTIRDVGALIVLGSPERILYERSKKEKLEPIGFIKGFKKKSKKEDGRN